MRPSYEQTFFPPEERHGRLRLVASRNGREGSVTIHQEAALYAALLAPGETVRHALAPGRHAYLHVARGAVHGFAGSAELMRGFAITLARAGFATVSWDFTGHGRNSRPLASFSDSTRLAQDAAAALAEANRRGLVDPGKVAILGHSMGSGVALTFGQERPETAATIAVSPVGVAVTPELPRNLLVMAGSLEPGFLQNARERLEEAGGEGGNPDQGTGRKLVVVPLVEHITILFAPAAHHAARDWLDAVFGAQPGAQPIL